MAGKTQIECLEHAARCERKAAAFYHDAHSELMWQIADHWRKLAEQKHRLDAVIGGAIAVAAGLASLRPQPAPYRSSGIELHQAEQASEQRRELV